ncbi:hypothetical protein SEUBUCD646_0F01200 [Saccharomyces eubayanus]|uniref:Uncharacterized protein n=1 Tax=Saccharomyces eubayanus TaxID=1080349 RepID=A0ABN8VS83_SACEU|nr:hypothetical protein SEUBUCD650_0F01180 [Saccharomyces eubayanus]CAI2004303.1 hypothetical protein SEUBUCD646_0F01200 [Saccharomyces eubayanus]
MTGYWLLPENSSYTYLATVDDSVVLPIEGVFERFNKILSAYFQINGIESRSADFPFNIEGSIYIYIGYFYPM